MKKYISVFVLGCAVLGLSACDFYQESYVTPKKLRVEQSRFDHSVDVQAFDSDHAASVASLYDGAGVGDVRLTVTYDPKSNVNTSARAHKNLAHTVSMLRANGISNVMGNIMPVHESGASSKVLITFDAYQAKAPEGCTSMPGFDGSGLETDLAYELGCTRESLVAKQIARPKDLVGQDLSGLSDGRRGANIVETYRSGTPNVPLEGETASGN
jgi:type IV pilus biogenesis protein CpaD/CtpE